MLTNYNKAMEKIRLLEEKLKYLEDPKRSGIIRLSNDLSLEEKLNAVIAAHYSAGVRNYAKAMEIDHIIKQPTFLSGEIPQFFASDLQDVYTPESCLKFMDLGVATLNYRVYCKLRKIEYEKKRNKCILLPEKKLKEISNEVNDESDNIISFKTELDEKTDIIRFDYKKLLINILKTHNIYEDIKNRNIDIAITIDGADISKKLSHVTAGIKVIDK